MPTTELEVANEALYALQEGPIATLSGPGKIAQALTFSIPIARRTTIRMFDWTCARRRGPLTVITEESPGVPVINFSGRRFVYNCPSTILTLIDVVSNGTQQPVQWIREGSRVYSDEPSAIGIYTVDLPNPADWDELLASAIAYMLAARIAFLVTGDQAREAALVQLGTAFVSAAKRQSYSETRQNRHPSEYWASGLFDAEARR